MKRANASDEPGWNGEVSKPKSRGVQILWRVASLGRRCVGPEAPKRRSVPPTCLWPVSAEGPTSLVHCETAENGERSGTSHAKTWSLTVIRTWMNWARPQA